MMTDRAPEHGPTGGDPTEGQAVSAPIYAVRDGVIGGLLGGIIMALVAMITGLAPGSGIWMPLNLVGATIVRRLQTAPPETLEQFMMVPLITGAILHLILSVGFGIAFVVLLPTLPGNKIVWSLIIGAILWAIALFAVLPLLNPLMLRLVNVPSFLIAHILYSLPLGYIIETSEPIETPPVP